MPRRNAEQTCLRCASFIVGTVPPVFVRGRDGLGRVQEAQLADAEERAKKAEARADRAEAELARLRGQGKPPADGGKSTSSVLG